MATINIFGFQIGSNKAKGSKEELGKKATIYMKGQKKLKDVVCEVNINPLPDDHLQVIKNTKIYTRTLYVSDLPRRATFAYTFEPVLKFGHSNVSVFVRPVREGKAIKELNDTIVDLDSERMMASGRNINRERRLSRLLQEAENLSEAIDSGENSLFEVSILITLYAKNYEELNKRTDDIRNKAKERGILLSSPYADQENAFISNLPVNNNKVGYYHLMDKFSVSTLFHYTRGQFGHKTGAILGRNLDTHQLVSYNFFERSMNGYNLLITGMTRSGKSTLIKIMVMRSCHPGGIEIISLDAEGEYGLTAEKVGGINIEISNSSKTIINPFEVDIELVTDKFTGREVARLDLTQKLNDVSYNLMTMARGSKPATAPVNDITQGIIKDMVQECYKKLEIYDGDIDSLYTVKNGERTKKDMPTIGMWYSFLEQNEKLYSTQTFREYYDYLLMVMKDYVRHKGGTKVYFDGQSTVSLKPGIPFINFDVSKLNEKYERPVAQSIIMDWMWETRVKKNSDDPMKAAQIVALFDETHYLLPYEEARQTLITFYRRAGKRNVATLTATQNINDYLMYTDSHAIFTNAATKILLRHDIKERNALKQLMNVTDVEADIITASQKGDIYIMSGNSKAFVHVDILPSEEVIIETDINRRKELEEARLRQQQDQSGKKVV